MDCSLPGSSVHGIFQARVLEWVAVSFSRGSSWHRDWTQVSHVVGRCFTIWATREVSYYIFSTRKAELPVVQVCVHACSVDSVVAYPFSSGSSRPRNLSGVSYLAGGFFTDWAIRGAHRSGSVCLMSHPHDAVRGTHRPPRAKCSPRISLYKWLRFPQGSHCWNFSFDLLETPN